MVNLEKDNINRFYGFGNNFNEENFSKLCELLNCKSPDPIFEDDTDAEVVEEAIRRKGTFYSPSEARQVIPWKSDKILPVVKIEYYDGEPKPNNPNFVDYNWLVLSPIQYMYAIYLQQQIAEDKLSLNNIIDKRPGRKNAIW